MKILYFSDECMNCLDAKPNIVFCPCKHCIVCVDCLKKLNEKFLGTCLYCKEKIEKMINFENVIVLKTKTKTKTKRKETCCEKKIEKTTNLEDVNVSKRKEIYIPNYSFRNYDYYNYHYTIKDIKLYYLTTIEDYDYYNYHYTIKDIKLYYLTTIEDYDYYLNYCKTKKIYY